MAKIIAEGQRALRMAPGNYGLACHYRGLPARKKPANKSGRKIDDYQNFPAPAPSPVSPPQLPAPRPGSSEVRTRASRSRVSQTNCGLIDHRRRGNGGG
jgi:hypothetical protein